MSNIVKWSFRSHRRTEGEKHLYLNNLSKKEILCKTVVNCFTTPKPDSSCRKKNIFKNKYVGSVFAVSCSWIKNRCFQQEGAEPVSFAMSVDSPGAAPGSSPPAGTPSASSAPRCCRDAPPPTQQRHKESGETEREAAAVCFHSLSANHHQKNKKKTKKGGKKTSTSTKPRSQN